MRFASMAIAYNIRGFHNLLLGKRILTEGFRQVRSTNNPLLESRYLIETAVTVSADTNFTPLMVSLMEQLAVDDKNGLPGYTVDEQCHALRLFSEIGNQYIQSVTPEACVRIESLAMQVIQRLHLHYALPWCTLGVLYFKQGKTQEALRLILDGVRISETPDGPFNGFGYEYAAYLYFAMGEYEKAFSFFDKCIPLIKKDPKLIYVPGGLFAYGIRGHLKLNRPEKALGLLKMITSLKIPLDATDSITMEVATADTWFALGRNDSAEKYYLKTLTYMRDNRFYQHQRYSNLAGFYVGSGQFAKAKPLLKELTADSNRAVISLVDQENNWRLRYRVDSAYDNIRQSIIDLRKYLFFHDSLINENKNKQLAEISIKYETEKKNQHIRDLEKQTVLQARLQESTIHQDHIIRYSLIAGAALLALFAIILYRRWRIRRRMSIRLEKLSRRQNELLAEKIQLISDKEVLMREMHHRVKNNLQIIISLLRLQAGQLKDHAAIGVFEDISSRINAISLVHKELYQEGQNTASIDIQTYIHNLTDFLCQGFGLAQYIRFDLEISPINLDVAQCVPLGLILNESITNAIKYAFPADRIRRTADVEDATTIINQLPAIHISLKEVPENYITLVIADNGVGLPAGLDLAQSKSLGFQLIQTFTQQLDGTLEMINRPHRSDYNLPPGVTFLIRFPSLRSMTSGEPARRPDPVKTL